MRCLPFDRKKLEELSSKGPTPFYIYDAKAIRENAERLKKAFSWNKGFREYFAVKANPNAQLMKLLRTCGFYSDCSSLAELVLAEKVGNVGDKIMFTSNDTPAEEFRKAMELGAIVNLDDITHWEALLEAAGRPAEIMCCRYNPGPLKGGNSIIGKPEEAKYGMTKEQIFSCYEKMRDFGVKRFGIHTMVASNELNPDYIVDTADMLFSLAVEIHERLGIDFEFVNIGGGIGIPYKPGEQAMDLEYTGIKIEECYRRRISGRAMKDIALYMECGRCITGPYGYLVSKVIHFKDTYRKYAGLDACMSNLMRPAMYDAYHEIVVPGKENFPRKAIYDVTGSLCENNDKFAVRRELPLLEKGDFVVICDAGAHGHAMGFQYNGKLRSAEILLEEDGSVREIRRAEILDDYFATQNFNGL
jgi:diaminopimelate decarboxylase